MLHNLNCYGLQKEVELKKQIEEGFSEAGEDFLSLNNLKPKFMKAPDDDSSSEDSSSSYEEESSSSESSFYEEESNSDETDSHDSYSHQGRYKHEYSDSDSD